MDLLKNSVLNTIAFICVVTSEAFDSIHGGFLTAVTLLGSIICIAVIILHISSTLASKIPPYPFAIFQVCFGVSFCIFHFAATSALLTKYSSIPVLVATAIFSYMSGLMHFLQSVLLFKAIKVTNIARQAMNFGNSIMGKQDANIEGNEEIKNESVAYKKDKDDIVMDPTQTVY